AKQSGVEGDVTVEFTVNDQGEVTDARAIEGHQLLRAAAVEAMRQFRFSTPSDGARSRYTAIFSFRNHESNAVAMGNQ
ncbi:MAG: TonB family protein, partial [Pyrinomonadaceae bacterium]|nr:TonB family protein [Pyrinomonadaceae bacterium]